MPLRQQKYKKHIPGLFFLCFYMQSRIQQAVVPTLYVTTLQPFGCVTARVAPFYVCAYPPSGDLSGAALGVRSVALLHTKTRLFVWLELRSPLLLPFLAARARLLVQFSKAKVNCFLHALNSDYRLRQQSSLVVSNAKHSWQKGHF